MKGGNQPEAVNRSFYMTDSSWPARVSVNPISERVYDSANTLQKFTGPPTRMDAGPLFTTLLTCLRL